MMATERRMDDLLTLLPDDLLQKILLPLPVESLVSLASTCNKWRDYLTDDDFARLHLDRWRSRYGLLYSGRGNLVYSQIFDGKANKLILARLEDCLSRIQKEDDHFRLLDSCDGLFLIVSDYYNSRKSRLVVCNPLMRSFKYLHLPPKTPVRTCHWNIVYDASIKRYKIIAIREGKEVCDDGDNIYSGRKVYILELCRSSSESSEWKEVSVCDDELGGGGEFGGEVQKSVLVDEKGNKKKLYYLTYNDGKSKGEEVRTNLIYIDIETHQVKAVAAAACSSMSTLRRYIWVGSSSTGRFYMSDLCHVREQFNLFVLEDLHNPIWKRLLINRTFDIWLTVIPVAVVQDNGNDEEEKLLYEIEGKIYEYQTVGGLWREVSNNTGHHFRDLCRYYHRDYVAYLHSLIRI